MGAADAVRGMLTALFAAAAVYTLRQAVLTRGSGWRGRGDSLLHTVMASAMAVMPWHLIDDGPPPGRTAFFFAAAALWFPLTAVLGLRGPRLSGLVHRSPHAVGMLAMAWMPVRQDRKSTRLNSSHPSISYAVFCLKKKKRKSKDVIETTR